MTELPRARSVRPKPRVQAGRSGPSWLALTGYAALALSCLVLGVVTFLIVAAPVDLLRDKIIQHLEARTGRTVTVAGPTSLTLFPRAAVTISDLSFAAPATMGGAPTVAVKTLDAEVGVASLFVGQPSIKRVVLTRPAIDLRSTRAASAAGNSRPAHRRLPRRRRPGVHHGRRRPRPGPAPRRCSTN